MSLQGIIKTWPTVLDVSSNAFNSSILQLQRPYNRITSSDTLLEKYHYRDTRQSKVKSLHARKYNENSYRLRNNEILRKQIPAIELKQLNELKD